jgi:DNA-directed RNA polymerase specialized sigma subunit
MSATDIAKEVVRIASTHGLAKDVIDLMEKKLALLTQEVTDLTSKNTILVTRVSQLESDKANLESQIQKLRPESDALDQQSKDILKFFFDRPDGLTSDEIAHRFKLSNSAADYHVDVLFKRKFLQQLSMGMSPRCCINHNGREFVMTHAV